MVVYLFAVEVQLRGDRWLGVRLFGQVRAQSDEHPELDEHRAKYARDKVTQPRVGGLVMLGTAVATEKLTFHELTLDKQGASRVSLCTLHTWPGSQTSRFESSLAATSVEREMRPSVSGSTHAEDLVDLRPQVS